MTADRIRQVLVVASFGFAIALNGAANALPLNGQTTGEISDRFRLFLIPAGFTFSIWGVIYLLQLAFVVHTLRPSRLEDPILRRMGLLPVIAALFNGTWIIAWHYNLYPISLALMLGLLASLIAIQTRGGIAQGARPGSFLRGADRWAVQVPFSVYLGWITVATITNVAVVGAAINVPTFGIEPPLIAAAVLTVGIAIAVLAVTRTGDVAFALVIAWAYAGIAVKEAEAGTPAVPLIAGVGVAIAILLVIGSLLRVLPAGRGGRAGNRAAPIRLARSR